MKIFVIDKNKYCVTSNNIYNYFNKHYEHNGYFDVIMPPAFSYPEGKKPYDPINKNQVINFLNKLIKKYELEIITCEQTKKMIEAIK